MPSLRYRNRSVFYHNPNLVKNRRPYGAPLNLNKPSLKGLNSTFRADEKKDLKARENLELLESIRHPRERDFYQDHTYHDQWEERKIEGANADQMRRMYPFFDPRFQVRPWIYHPGDLVEVVVGEQSGQRGTIIAVVPYKNELIVQNINVKDVSIPASDSRPEQVVQREHPINCRKVKHVDPTTGTLCDLQLVTVRVRNEDGTMSDKTEEKRISLVSGAILPIPTRDDQQGVATGDPLRDTPYHDAQEVSYRPEEELAVLTERKLAALEKHFVRSLERSYKFHSKLMLSNEQQLRQFQRDAFTFAVDRVAQDMDEKAADLDDWWFEHLAPHMEALDREEAAAAAAAFERGGASATGLGSAGGGDETEASAAAHDDGDVLDDDQDSEEYEEYEEVEEGVEDEPHEGGDRDSRTPPRDGPGRR